MTEIHQFLPTFASRDAIGMHTLRLRRVLRDAGFASEIYADDIHEEVRGEARPYLEYESRPRSGEGPAFLSPQDFAHDPIAIISGCPGCRDQQQPGEQILQLIEPANVAFDRYNFSRQVR